MEKKENISLPLFPRVSKETIGELVYLADENLKFKKAFEDETLFAENLPFINTMTTLAKELNKQDFSRSKTELLSPGYAVGQIMIYAILANEAQKNRIKMPSISIDNVMNMLAYASKRFALHSPEKFKPENPDLMDFVEEIYNRTLEKRLAGKHLSFVYFMDLYRGALRGYELLLSSAEKERSKGLNL